MYIFTRQNIGDSNRHYIALDYISENMVKCFMRANMKRFFLRRLYENTTNIPGQQR